MTQFELRWAAYEPEIAIITSTQSDRYNPGNFASFEQGLPLGFVAGHPALVIAPTCGSGNFDTTHAIYAVAPVTLHERTVAEHFLFTASGGAIAWVGASQGTWTSGNQALGRALSERVVENPARSIAESFTLATRDVLLAHGLQSAVAATATSYSFLGDPFTRLTHAPRVTAVDPVVDSRGGTAVRVAPNPFNPYTEISFFIRGEEDAVVRVIDGRGRVVRTIHRPGLTQGSHTVVWDGRSEDGRVAASGVYYILVTTGAETSRAKLILLK